MNRIIIVSELFYPDGTSTAHILTKIADVLNETHDVIVLAGPANYSSDNVKDYCGQEKTYLIKRISVGEFDKNKLFSRIAKFFVTSFKLGHLLLKNSRKNDEVIIVTNPAPFLILASLIKKIRRYKLTIIVHDVFPENTIPAGILKSTDSFLYKISKAIFSRAYLCSDRIIVLGRDMKEFFLNKLKGKKNIPEIEIIENWADKASIVAKKRPSEIENKVKILYAGNIGRCQGLEKFIQIYKEVANDNVQLILRGGGAIVEEIRNVITDSKSEIILGGSFSREEQFDILSDCDIALVTLADGMYGLGVPSKSYNIMAAGKPILFIGNINSEIALTVKENNLGYCFDNKDTEGLKKWLSELSKSFKDELRLKGENALNIAASKYSEDLILSKYSRLFSIH